MSNQIKYHVYYSTSLDGPWTRATTNPIDDNPSGNHYLIDNLTNGQLYYIMVVGGKINVDGDFVGICGQPLVNEPSPGAEGPTSPNIVMAKPRAIPST